MFKFLSLLVLFVGFINPPVLREGTHAVTHQMISWDAPGKVEIKKMADGNYHIAGGQKNKENGDYLKINGTLQVMNTRELTFEGDILTRITGINNDSECKRSGIYHFKATGKRKYYRLQEMTNCEGGMITEYVDIYF